MHLRVSNASIYFPINDGTPVAGETGNVQAKGLGGTKTVYRGKPVVRALDNVSLSLGHGDRLAVVGHNGSGKSTLLRVLAGLYFPQEGTVQCDSAVSGIFNMSIGFRQDATGYRNIVLKGLMAGRTRREIEAAIPLIEEFTGLGHYLSMPLRTYSQGMALRLAFAITTTFSHDILIMDEWIGAGDASFQEKVVARMNSFLETSHICVLASHNNQLLRRVTDQCLWLQDGAIRAMGDTSVILDEYEQETRLLRQAFEEEVTIERIPIPDGYRAFWERPGSDVSPRIVDLEWNVASFGVGRVKVSVYDPATDTERLVCTAPATGHRQTGGWARDGMEFRLRDEVDDLLLGKLVVGAMAMKPSGSHA